MLKKAVALCVCVLCGCGDTDMSTTKTQSSMGFALTNPCLNGDEQYQIPVDFDVFDFRRDPYPDLARNSPNIGRNLSSFSTYPKYGNNVKYRYDVYTHPFFSEHLMIPSFYPYDSGDVLSIGFEEGSTYNVSPTNTSSLSIYDHSYEQSSMFSQNHFEINWKSNEATPGLPSSNSDGWLISELYLKCRRSYSNNEYREPTKIQSNDVYDLILYGTGDVLYFELPYCTMPPS